MGVGDGQGSFKAGGPEGLSEEVAFTRNCNESDTMDHVAIWGKSNLGRGNSKCEDPEAGKGLPFLRKRKEASEVDTYSSISCPQLSQTGATDHVTQPETEAWRGVTQLASG